MRDYLPELPQMQDEVTQNVPHTYNASDYYPRPKDQAQERPSHLLLIVFPLSWKEGLFWALPGRRRFF